MPSPRLLQILDLIRAAREADPGTGRLCTVSAAVTGMTGAGVMLMSGDVPRGSLCSSDEVSALIEDLQYTLGEGPCVDAYGQDRPVLEPDLCTDGRSRWLAFAPPALEAGARATFGFPLQIGSVRLGALNLYRDRPGPLTDAQHGDALILTGVIARAVLVMQAEAELGAIPAALEEGADLRLVVHQAAGMVAAQLGVSVAEALVRLRARAFADDRLLVQVAADVVGRRLRFD
ncbi:MAG: GAF and ANTAR domain-containing protein [Acidimicrobiales bacterium]